MGIKTGMQGVKEYSPYQFSFFRIILGIYLFVHFSMLLPWAGEIWSNEGLLADASLNFTHGVFPNILNVADSPAFVLAFVAVLTLLSALFTFGIYRPVLAVLLWYGWVCLFDRNNLISNPGIPFIGWLLLVSAVVPVGEPLSLTGKAKEGEWKLPVILFAGAWIIMCLSYSISGIDKLGSPSWRDGSAIIHLLENPLARNWWLREALLDLPAGILKMITWSILSLEIVFLPLALISRTRGLAWLSMILMHLGILMIVDFADLTLGMLMIHLFTFDGRWLKGKRADMEKNIVFFDGVCGLCNSFIDLLMREDKKNVLAFAPLQGETAKATIPGINPSELKTIMYHSRGRLLEKSDAVLQILADIGGIWKIAVIFKVIPAGIRNRVYDIIARNRYKWFGKKESCRMPTKEEREKLLT